MASDKLGSFFTANKLKYGPSLLGILYNLLFSYKGKCIIYVYYVANNENILAFFLRRILKKKYHFEVGKRVNIGHSLVLNHPFNIIIDADCKLGNNCQVDQNVTIGGNMKRESIRDGVKYIRPSIGNSVILSAGCVVAGPIVIGDNCIIGANTTVTHDVPEGKIVYNLNKVSTKNIIVGQGTFKVKD